MPIIVPTTGYFTVAEARKLKPLDDTATYPDADIDAARQMAEQSIEQACGVAFIPRTEVETVSGNGLNTLMLKHPKVTSVQAVTVGGVAYASADLAGVTVLPDTGQLYNTALWTSGRANVVITYTHGFDAVPLRVKQAAMLLTRRWLVDGPFDDRATSMTTDDGTFSLITPGVRGAVTDLPEVNATIDQYGYIEGVG